MSLITKLDFNSDRVPFTQNLDNRLIEPFINLVEKMEFKPIVPTLFYTAITTSPGTELSAFLEDHVKDYLVFATMAPFIAEHGKFIMQTGYREYVDNTSQPVSDVSRSFSVKFWEKNKNVAYTTMMNRAKDVNYTWDGVRYNFTSNCDAKPDKNFGIRAVGVNTNFDGPGRNYNDMY